MKPIYILATLHELFKEEMRMNYTAQVGKDGDSLFVTIYGNRFEIFEDLSVSTPNIGKTCQAMLLQKLLKTTNKPAPKLPDDPKVTRLRPNQLHLGTV